MEKVYRIYEVVDVDTGELLNKDQRKNYITVSVETTKSKENGKIIERTKRIVRHNGQQGLNI